jgi:macrolide-specific efflux system membrane fusion protein
MKFNKIFKNFNNYLIVNKLKILIVLLVFIFLCLYIKIYWIDETILTKNMKQQVIAECENIEDVVSAGGILQPERLVSVGADASGVLKDMFVEVGSTVISDQLLATIDPIVQSELVKSSQFDVNNAELQLRSNELMLQDASIEMQRQMRMYESGAVSDFIKKESQLKYANAEINFKSARNRLNQSQTKLAIEKAKLSHTNIKAPLSGVITEILIRPGESIVNIQQVPTILRIADVSKMIVNVQVSQVDIGSIYVGMPARFIIQGNSLDIWNGRIEQISPIPKLVMGINTYNTTFKVDNSNHKLMAGMQVQTFFVRAFAENAVIIPLEALQENASTLLPSSGSLKSAKVIVINKDGVESLRAVQLGIFNQQKVQIISGIQCGEKVVLNGNLTVMQGSQR